jgi:hypothetical protein
MSANDLNPYQSPVEVNEPLEDDMPQGLLEALAAEAPRTMPWLLVAAILTGLPGSMSLVGAALLLTTDMGDRVHLAVWGAILLGIMLLFTSLRAALRTFVRQPEPQFVRAVARGYGRLFLTAAIVLLLTAIFLPLLAILG